MSDLPPLPEATLTEVRNPMTGERNVSTHGAAYYGSNWREVRKLYTADETRAYARAAVAAERAKWDGIEQYLIAAAAGSMSRNNSEALAAELLEQVQAIRREPT